MKVNLETTTGAYFPAHYGYNNANRVFSYKMLDIASPSFHMRRKKASESLLSGTKGNILMIIFEKTAGT